MKYALSNILGDPFWLITIPMALIGWAVALVGSILNNSFDSSTFPVFSWWGISFEMIAILLTLHVAFTNQIRMYRQAILVYLGVATVYTTNSTNNFVWRDNSSSGTAAAGNILLSIINFIWIIYFGTTQDEPMHMYVDSFAVYKKTTPPKAEFYQKMRERRKGSGYDAQKKLDVGRNPRGQPLGTSGNPYRMSDIPQDIEIGPPRNFTHSTDPSNPRGNVDARTSGPSQGSDPLRSTYLYSVDQLRRHGLEGHEFQPEDEAHIDSRQSLGTILPYPMDTEDPYLEDQEEDAYDTSQPIARAKARFSYEARPSDGEMPFKEGEVLDVCDMTGNWWYCKRSNGDAGICPRNYLELIEEPQLL